MKTSCGDAANGSAGRMEDVKGMMVTECEVARGAWVGLSSRNRTTTSIGVDALRCT